MDIVSELWDEIAFLLVALILAFGIYQTAGVALGTDVPVVAVTSGSMEPILERGDMVVVKGESFADIREGDIIVFNTQSRCLPVPIIHRVVNKTADSLETQGDNNPSQLVLCQGRFQCSQTFNSCPSGTERVAIEEGITPGQVKGVVAFKTPKLGYVKLIPTCAYLQVTQEHVPATLCP